ncbi:hypothetical protein HFD88_001180 [Aspergillus terreus]|nr:hypothetical protein HFD88_001180 [Aspergillus terreus]
MEAASSRNLITVVQAGDSNPTRQERGLYLLQAADKLQKHSQELEVLLCLENGKPVKDASFDGNIYSSVIYEPHGVCVGILPFNWPPAHARGKLAAGNTMVRKPGEQDPLTLVRIVEIMQSVFPADVVQAVPVLGGEVPQALIHHKLVKMVSLTGSIVRCTKPCSCA